jgi:uncharacterized protein (DUF433 family)
MAWYPSWSAAIVRRFFDMDPVPNATFPDRIDTTVRAGESGPVFRGTQVSVDEVLRKLAARQSWDAILDAYSSLTSDDLAAAVEYERILTRKWVKQWAVTGPLLEEIRRRELREMTAERRQQAIEAVLSVVPIATDPRPSSGLVVLQHWFARSRS